MRTSTPSLIEFEDDRDQRDADEDEGISLDLDDDPLPHHVHREHRPDDEIEEAELAGDDLAELGEDDLINAEGPDA